MKLFTYVENGAEHLGAETADGGLVDLRAAKAARGGAGLEAFDSMLALIDAGNGALAEARELVADPPAGTVRAKDAVRIIAPLPQPRKLHGYSAFERHLVQSSEGVARMLAAKEADPEAAYAHIRKAMGLDNVPSPGWKATPAYYLPDVTVITGTDETVEWPAYSNWIDYELEIVAVTGKTGKDIAKEKAVDHIFGYSILNDLSARDAQLKAMQTGAGVGKGKDFDKSNPLGPCIVTADEIGDPYKLKTRIAVNGEEWSRSSLEGPHWTFADCIAHASQGQTIRPGELFSTGCVPDCCAIELQRDLKRGDTVALEVDGIGVLSTHIA